MSIHLFTQHLSANNLDIALVKTQLSAYFDNTTLYAEPLCAEVKTACALLLALQQAQCQGHSFIHLQELAGQTYFSDSNSDVPVAEHKTGYLFPELSHINNVIHQMQQHPIHGPLLIVNNHRLFSQKIFEYEQFISQDVSKRIRTLNIDIAPQVLTLFSQLYPEPANNPWQSIASIAALSQPFYIINGGPGTGKTYTVLRTLLLILAQQQTSLSIGLCAPTGKAAQRVSESIINEISVLKSRSIALALLEQIPEQATTIHRLLGIRKGSGEARFNKTHPLPYDLLVVDEASMLDTALFYRLLSACRTDTRIILIGDTAQLPSVESGAVLHDLMPQRINGFSDDLYAWIDLFDSSIAQQAKKAQKSEFSSASSSDNVNSMVQTNYATTLLQNMRSNANVNDVANAIYSGNTRLMLAKLADVQQLWSEAEPDITILSHSLLLSQAHPDENMFELLKAKQSQCLLAFSKGYYKSLLNCSDPVDALEQLKQFRILTPVRHGLFGVSGINNFIDQYLLKQISDPTKISINGMYHGRAILITQNDAQLGVFNGDSGVVLLNEDNVLTAYIDRGKQPPLAISPFRLPAVQSLYAMTIHKTQGSEFERVLIILPPEESVGVSKELIYTGITRARSYVAVLGIEKALTQAISRHHQRNTGIVVSKNSGQ